jgi:hypothetical protein
MFLLQRRLLEVIIDVKSFQLAYGRKLTSTSEPSDFQLKEESENRAYRILVGDFYCLQPLICKFLKLSEEEAPKDVIEKCCLFQEEAMKLTELADTKKGDQDESKTS